ncbi:hypothetical protein BD410DRAFT_886203 [Rickenella mellea]|uniref:Uncharacterized protein n=1 Tax=Rickenella mellea TaxID=50990 RepID=A0A4Y7PPU0_9AGAM|nr:hypothetical protein BD410DRAFT_886203 [Rickenella mellea]
MPNLRNSHCHSPEPKDIYKPIDWEDTFTLPQPDLECTNPVFEVTHAPPRRGCAWYIKFKLGLAGRSRTNCTAHSFPVEIWGMIFAHACSDDGTTGHRLRLSCKKLSEIVKPYQWQSFVIGSSQEMCGFAAYLDANPDIFSERGRPIYHLYCSTVNSCFEYDGCAQQESLKKILEYAGPTLTTLTCDERVVYPNHKMLPSDPGERNHDYRISCEIFQALLPKLTELSLHTSGDFPRRVYGRDLGRFWPGSAVRINTNWPSLRFMHLSGAAFYHTIESWEKYEKHTSLKTLMQLNNGLTHFRVTFESAYEEDSMDHETRALAAIIAEFLRGKGDITKETAEEYHANIRSPFMIDAFPSSLTHLVVAPPAKPYPRYLKYYTSEKEYRDEEWYKSFEGERDAQKARTRQIAQICSGSQDRGLFHMLLPKDGCEYGQDEDIIKLSNHNAVSLYSIADRDRDVTYSRRDVYYDWLDRVGGGPGCWLVENGTKSTEGDGLLRRVIVALQNLIRAIRR